MPSDSRRWRKWTGMLALGAALSALPALAAAAHYQVDPVHSFVMFRVGHMGVGHVYGRFDEVAGEFSFDAETPQNSSASVTVQTASVDTGVEKRDAHLKTADFFDVAQYPTMSFKSTAIKKVTDDVYEIAGDLTIHGVTKPVTVAAVHIGTMDSDQPNKSRTGFEATVIIQRSEFGMNKMIPAAGDMVSITLGIEGVR